MSAVGTAIADLLTLDQAAAHPRWSAMCGPGDLFCTPRWFAVERERVGPWVPRQAGCVARFAEGRLLAGTPVQLFDDTVDDETVRLDKMLPGTPAAAALPQALMCGTWFNSSVLVSGELSAAAAADARADVVAAAVALGQEWAATAVFFPFLDAADTALRATLRDTGFIEFPAPDRHVFDCDHPSYDAYVAALRSKHRNRLRKELATVDSAGLRTGAVTVDDANVEHVAWLAHQLEGKYDQQSTVDQMADWFAAIARHTETTAYVAGPPGEPPIAMSMWVTHQDRRYGFHAGFDYQRAQGLPLYSLVGYHLPIRDACDRDDITVLEYGVGSDQAKLLRGTTALPQVLCVRPLTDTVAAAVHEARYGVA